MKGLRAEIVKVRELAKAMEMDYVILADKKTGKVEHYLAYSIKNNPAILEFETYVCTISHTGAL